MSKTDLFDKQLQETAQVFKAFSHPARLAILKYLAEANTCICGDISKELPLSRTTVNQHLKELKKLGVIHGDIEGVKVNYCINYTKIESIGKTIEDFVKNIQCCNIERCK
jgi:DNA-binding transcriptional ArsR family regulator